MSAPSAARSAGRRAPAKQRTRGHGLRVLVSDAVGRSLSAGGLSAWLRRAAPARARGTVHVALVSDARVRDLNRRYRRMDATTDVLSFPADPSPARRRADDRDPARPRRVSHQPPAPSPCLGDIVIATGCAQRQARGAGHPLSTELRVLALHGLLHLLGYDHERDDGRMGRVERRLRRKGGLQEGLIERG